LKPHYECAAVDLRDPGPALQLIRVESERRELSAPFSRRIAESLDADAAGQAAFYGCLDKIGREEGERDGHIDLSSAAFLASAVVDINTPINRIVPLAPDIAIRILPDIRLSGVKPDLSFAKFSASLRTPKRAEVLDINRLIVRCAEDLVLYRDDQAWIEGYVKKNRLYRVEPMTQELSYDGGAVNISTMRIRPRVDVHGAADNT
jgi:hypothetical protein